MKHLVLFCSIILFFTFSVQAQENDGLFKYFFKARPVELGFVDSNKPKWEFKPTVQIPAIKVTESIRENAQLDATFLASAGGGLTLQNTIVKDGKNYSKFSWTPVMFLLTGDTSKDNPLDLSYCTTVGFFNNLLQFGIGYDFGTVQDRSRVFGVLSLGINITNN